MTVTARRDEIQRHITGATAPAAIEAEKALLGIALSNADALDLIEGLTPEHFYEPLHGRLWGAIQSRYASGSLADTAILDGLFVQDEAYRTKGGLTYLDALVALAPGAARAEAYAAEIRDTAARRAIMRLANDIADKAAGVEEEEAGAAEILAMLEAGASEIAKTADVGDAWMNPGEMIAGAVERAKASRGVIEFPLGIPEFDRLLGGLHRQEVTVLAARPGVGKTVGAQAYARAIAQNGMAVAFFALEMGPDPMALRLACDLAYDRDLPCHMGVTSNITLSKINSGELNEGQWDQLTQAQRWAARMPLRYDARPGHTMARIEALSRRLFRKAERHGVKPGLVVIDHMGKVRPPKGHRGDLRAEAISVSRDASEMAKRLDVPVLLLCQLNRGVEGRQDKQPNLADLREAGQIEEDARQVIFLHRPEYYLRPPADTESETFDQRLDREAKLEAARNKLHWIVAKNSHGPTGSALTFCDIAASAVREWR